MPHADEASTRRDETGPSWLTWRRGVALGVFAILAAGLAWLVVEGLGAIGTTLVGVAIASNLTLILLDIASDRAGAAPVVHQVEPVPGSDAAPLAGLTEQETATLRLMARGMNDEEIAVHTDTDEVTVKTDVSRLMTKLGVRDSAQAVVFAYEAGLVQPASVVRE